MRFCFIFSFLFFINNIFSLNTLDFKKYFENYEKKYIIYISKEQKKLFLIDGKQKVIKEYKIATGANEGPKLYSGDNRTPEGEYEITKILSYKKPQYLIEKEKSLNKKELKKLLQEYEKWRNELKKMNDTYLRAKDGHKKFGTEVDLGYNSYGPVFIRINYPNEQDKKNYEKAKKENKIPKENGNFKSIGTGIAIHGTNDENSIGHNASSGCVRMRNEDIEDLLFYIEPKLKVIIKGGKDE